MKELYDLKDMLCEELKEYGKKGELSAGGLDIVDKLSHALKSVETIIAMEEAYDSDYSGNYRTRPYYDGRSYTGRDYNGGGSYARRRDSMGRYSRGGNSYDAHELADELKDLMDDAPNDMIKQEMKRLVSKIEKM